MGHFSIVIIQFLTVWTSFAFGFTRHLEFYQLNGDASDYVPDKHNSPNTVDEGCQETVRDKILGKMLGGSAEQSLHQMQLTDPGILENLAGESLQNLHEHVIQPRSDNEKPVESKPISKDSKSNRRFLFTPTIENTVINNNSNQNTISASNQINDNSSSNILSANSGLPYVPYPVVVNPNFPLLTYVLSGLLKGSAKVEHKGHKPTKICFEL